MIEEQLLFWKQPKQYRIYVKIFAGIVLLIVAACIINAKIHAKYVVAVVDGEKITINELKAKISSYPDFYKQYAQQLPQQALDDYIDELLLVHKAGHYYLRYRKDIARQVEDYRRQLLIKEFLNEMVLSKADITSDEVKDYYNSHLNDFYLPERVHLYEIVLSSQEEAESVLKRLNLGGDFSEIAMKESKGPTKEKGGDMGLIAKGQLFPELESIIFQMKEHEILDKVIKTEQGYHVIKIGEKYPSQIQTLEEATPSIKQLVINQKRKQILDDYIKELKKNARVKVFEERLKGL